MKTCMQSCNGLEVFIKHFVMYPLQYGCTPLHLAAKGGHTTFVERLLSTPGIDVNIKSMVSWFIERCCTVYMDNTCTVFRRVIVHMLGLGVR